MAAAVLVWAASAGGRGDGGVGTFDNPVMSRDFPDPAVVRAGDGTFWVRAQHSNFWVRALTPRH